VQENEKKLEQEENKKFAYVLEKYKKLVCQILFFLIEFHKKQNMVVAV